MSITLNSLPNPAVPLSAVQAKPEHTYLPQTQPDTFTRTATSVQFSGWFETKTNQPWNNRPPGSGTPPLEELSTNLKKVGRTIKSIGLSEQELISFLNKNTKSITYSPNKLKRLNTFFNLIDQFFNKSFKNKKFDAISTANILILLMQASENTAFANGGTSELNPDNFMSTNWLSYDDRGGHTTKQLWQKTSNKTITRIPFTEKLKSQPKNSNSIYVVLPSASQVTIIRPNGTISVISTNNNKVSQYGGIIDFDKFNSTDVIFRTNKGKTHTADWFKKLINKK